MFGIWIDPHDDFGEAEFRSNALHYVENVLPCTEDYSCILAYIIMNDPQINDIINGGPENPVSLWQSFEYGLFQKRIYTQNIIFRDDWAGAIAAPENYCC